MPILANIPPVLDQTSLQVRNESGVTLTKNTAVAVVGFNVTEALPLVDVAKNNDPALRPAVGLVLEDIPNNANGELIVSGRRGGLNTSGFPINAQLVLGTNGDLVRPPPDQDPFAGEIQPMGSVSRVDAVDGEVILSIIQDLSIVTGAQAFYLREATYSGFISGGALTRGAGLDISVAAGLGFVNIAGVLTRVTWAADTVTAPASSTFFVSVDVNGVVSVGASPPSLNTNIVLGSGRTSASAVILLSSHNVELNQIPGRIHDYAKDVVGPTSVSGTVATIHSSPSLQLAVDSGQFFIYDVRKTAVANAPITFTYWYRDGVGGWTFVTGQTAIDPNNYDDGSGTLAAIPAGEYKKDLLFVAVSEDGTEYHVVYGQETFPAQQDAEVGNNPAADGRLLQDALRIAGVVVQEGATSIASVVDQRPFIGQSATGVTAVSDHGGLGGLGDDDHSQYQLRSEQSQANGYPSLDGATKIPIAEIPTAVPGASVDAGDAAVEGVATSVARSDHQHAVSTAAPAAVGVGPSSAEGVATTLARSDHSHQANTPPVNVTKAAAAVGGSGEPARADHKHDIDTAAPTTPIGTGTVNAEGAATTIARSDHSHEVSLPVSQATATGTTTTPSNTDVLMAGMTLTPGAGDYLAMFSTSMESDSNNTDMRISLYVNGAQIAHTERRQEVSKNTPRPMTVQAHLPGVGAGQAVEVRWRTNTGTITAHERTFTLVRID